MKYKLKVIQLDQFFLVVFSLNVYQCNIKITVYIYASRPYPAVHNVLISTSHCITEAAIEALNNIVNHASSTVIFRRCRLQSHATRSRSFNEVIQPGQDHATKSWLWKYPSALRKLLIFPVLTSYILHNYSDADIHKYY